MAQSTGLTVRRQCDVEHLVGNKKAKAIQVTLTDIQPLANPTSGEGFNWATISIEMGVEDGGRLPEPTGRAARVKWAMTNSVGNTGGGAPWYQGGSGGGPALKRLSQQWK